MLWSSDVCQIPQLHDFFFFFLPSNFNIQWPVEKQRKQVDDLIQCLEVLLFQNWAAFKGIMRQVSIGKCVCKVSVLFGLMGESPGHDIRPSVGSWFWDLDSWPGSSSSCFMLVPSEAEPSVREYNLQGEEDHFSKSYWFFRWNMYPESSGVDVWTLLLAGILPYVLFWYT